MAHPKRFELLTPRFVVWCSIQLSYGCARPRTARAGLYPTYAGGARPGSTVFRDDFMAGASGVSFGALKRQGAAPI